MGPAGESSHRALGDDRSEPPSEGVDFAASIAQASLSIDSLSSPEFRRALDAVPAMIWLASPPGQCIHVNKPWMEFTGRNAAQDLGKGWMDCIDPRDWAHCKDLHGAALQDRRPFRIEYRMRRSDGHYRWVLDCGLPLVDSAGRFFGYIGSCVDITEHKQTDEALREAEERYRSIVATMAEGVVVTDDTGVVQLCNASAERILELSAQNLVGRCVKDTRWGAIHEDGRTFSPDSFPVMVTLATSRPCFNVILGLPRPNDDVVWVSINTQPLFGEGGRPRGVVATFVDISERKKAERALHCAHEQLEQRVRERTADLENANDRLRVEIEERQRTERELKESEERYRVVLGRAPDAIFLHDGERVLFANRQTAALYGVQQPSDMLDLTIWDIIAPPYHAEIRKRIETLRTRGGVLPVIETFLRRADGTTLPIETTAAVCPYKGQTVIQVIARDISARKAAEESLRKSAEQISDLYNHAPCGYHSLDPDGMVVRMNDTELNWLGYRREEVVGVKRFDELISPKGRVIFPVTFGSMKVTGRVRDLEFELVRKDGTILPVVINATAVRDAEGRFVMTRSTVFDMTELRQANEALRESEERFRQLAEASFEGIAIHEGGTILDANETLGLMFGYEGRELIGKTRTELVVPATHMAAPNSMRDSSSEAGERPYETLGVRRDGSVFPIEVRAKAVPYQGRTVQVTAVRDLTLRKQAEDRARQHQEQLAHVLRLSTMGEMAAGLAHELNQPLSAIVNYAQGCLRRMQGDPGSSQELLDALRQVTLQAGRAGDIIRRLRDFVRDQTTQHARIGINDAVQEAVQFISPGVLRDGLSIDVELTPGLPEVEVDMIQIEQVLLNLLRNSCEALYDGHEWPQRLTVRTELGERGMIEVAVHDTGPGVSPAVLARLFQPFFTTKPEGMGLGLSISKSIIEAHGGRLWATPNPDRGMTFRFSLPAIGRTPRPVS